MFGTVRSAEGKAALEAIKRGKSSLWQSLTVETDPVALMMQDAVYRSSAFLQKTTPITPDEKLDAFRIMGFEAVPKQLEIVRDTHPIRVVRAGRRSGKTTLAAHEAVAVMLKKPGSMGWVVAPDYELAFRCWEIIVAELDKLVARGLMKYKVKNNSTTNMRIVMDNGSTVEGKSCENAEDLQGVGLDWLVIDEIGIVLPFVFLEFLIPALSDRDGWAFLIGTPIGENWTEKEVRHQKRLADLAGKESDWSEHLFETWHNLKAFPGGRNDPKILRMERNMPFEEWMEQVCAQPQRSRYVTYKEFDDQVHLRRCAFNPDLPVQLSIDPSTGVNPYAVAVFQDYGDVLYQIDEYYRMSVLAQDVIADLATRPWWGNVNEAFVDDAWPQEKKFWQQHQDVTFWMRSAGKSQQIIDSIPVVRNWLRDPVAYNEHLAPVRKKIVEELYPGKAWETLDIEDQRLVNGRAEVRLSDNKTVLLDCARYFIDKSCLNTVDEFTGYSYRRRKRDDANPSESPAQHKDHLMDAIRYYIFAKKKRWGMRPVRPTTYMPNA
jgi:hypothetical protein